MAPVVQRSSPKASPTKIRKGSKPPPWSLSDQVVATPSKHAVAAHKQRGRQQAGICKILDRDGDRRDDRRFQTCDALVFAAAVRTSKAASAGSADGDGDRNPVNSADLSCCA